MKWALRTVAVMAVIAALVVCVGLAFTGTPTQAKYLPTGQGVSQGSGPNVFHNSHASVRRQGANGWLKEYSTTTAPMYGRRGNGTRITFTGSSDDTGSHRRIEVFQASWHTVRPGQVWRFSIKIRGQISKDYIIIGIEWIGGPRAPYQYLSEQDVYPQISNNWQRATVVTPPLPKSAKSVTAYIQIPEVNPMSRIDAWFADPSLVLSSRT
jgi:hypothetical protein